MNLGTFLGGILQSVFNAATVVGQVIGSLTGAIASVAGTIAAQMVERVSVFTRQVSEGLIAVGAYTKARIDGLTKEVNQFGAALSTLWSITPERTRQYFLARLGANPLGVLTEAPTRAYKAGGSPSLPDPNPGAPWVTLAGLRADVASFRVDPQHQVQLACAECRADVQAWRAGRPAVLPPWPREPADLPGYMPPPAPRGAHPEARELLQPFDQPYIERTTS